MKSTKKLQVLLNKLDIHERDLETYQRMMVRSPSDNLKSRLNTTMIAKNQLEQTIIKLVPTVEKEIELIKIEKEFSQLMNSISLGLNVDLDVVYSKQDEIEQLKKEIDERIN